MKRLAATFLLLFLLAPAAAMAQSETIQDDTIYQVSTIQGLLNGQYMGEVSFRELAAHGDFGIGTFDELDGEMVAFDGEFYQVDWYGKVREVPPSWGTPFAVVTHFSPDIELEYKYVRDLEDLKTRLKKDLPGLNLFYALRIDGLFQYVKTRSVPAQEKPYPPLAEAVKNQSEFEMKDTIGTVVGFYTPEFGGKVNVPGFHMHYLDQYHENGGHMLDISAGKIVVQVDRSPYLFVNLPLATATEKMEDRTHELETIEN